MLGIQVNELDTINQKYYMIKMETLILMRIVVKYISVNVLDLTLNPLTFYILTNNKDGTVLQSSTY